ncbi:hypothetical protein CEXT_445111 [Caerostris extrusa]|uniref:Uncharacterized protein n=1 Tax=Caerostris extrusa TaxID=172846 RepID=A0AAV4XA38_CAEEX|nr:hypothetical protein CEXT_445111 [Caerostris extrusa]
MGYGFLECRGRGANFGGTQSQNRVLVHDHPSVNPCVFLSEVKRRSFSLGGYSNRIPRRNLMRPNRMRGNVGRSDSSRSSFDVVGVSRDCSGLELLIIDSSVYENFCRKISGLVWIYGGAVCESLVISQLRKQI